MSHDRSDPGATRLERWLDRLTGVGSGKLRIIDGVRYKERRPGTFSGVFTSTEHGVREYEVRFPNSDARARPMRIRATPTRIFDDLTPDPRRTLVKSLDAVVRPGDRVLDLGCGTGAASHHLAYLVGPSGGVVALDRDGESIRFARQRYASPQLGYELGWIETLAGELDGAFDTVVAVDPLRDTPNEPERDRRVEELLRVLRAGGHLFCIGSSAESGEQTRRTLVRHAVEQVGQPVHCGDWRATLWKREIPGRTAPDGDTIRP